MFRKPVGDRGIPVIHSAPKMLHEDERHAARLAEPTIGEADSISLYELCRRGLVAVLGHWRIPLTVGLETTRGGGLENLCLPNPPTPPSRSLLPDPPPTRA